METSLFHSFFVHKFFVFNNNFWQNSLKIESFKIIPFTSKNKPEMIINSIVSSKPFYAVLNSLHNVYFYTRFIKKNKSFKYLFLVFRFFISVKNINTIIFDIIFFWKNFSFSINKIFKFFKNSSNLNYFMILNDTKRVFIKYTYLNLFCLDFNYMVTNTFLIFYFREFSDFSLFVKYFKTLLFESFFLRKKFINEKT